MELSGQSSRSGAGLARSAIETKTVPTEPAEEPSAHPLMRDPGGSEQKGKPQIVCRSLPRRTRRCDDRLAAARQHRAPFICVEIVRACPESFRGHYGRADESNKPTPKCKTNSEIKREQQR